MALALVGSLGRKGATLLAVLTLSFFIAGWIRPSPFAEERGIPEAVRRAEERRIGLDRPLAVQWARYMGRLARLDLGDSWRYDQTVNGILASALPHSLLLGSLALAAAIPAALLLGVLAASRRGGWLDALLLAKTTLWILVPPFVLGPVLLVLFSVRLGWFPVAGWGTARGAVLPVLALAPAYAAALFRLVRGGIVEALDEPFSRAARARGCSRARVLWRHALRPGLAPALGYLGPAAASVLTGTLAVEKVFAIPGLGKHFVDAVLQYDRNVLLGTVLVYTAFLLALTAVTDGIAAWADPRMRADRRGARG